MQISVEQANINLEEGTVTLTGYDVSEIISEIGQEELLSAMDYSDIKEYITEVDSQRESDDYDARTAHIQ